MVHRDCLVKKFFVEAVCVGSLTLHFLSTLLNPTFNIFTKTLTLSRDKYFFLPPIRTLLKYPSILSLFSSFYFPLSLSLFTLFLSSPPLSLIFPPKSLSPALTLSIILPFNFLTLFLHFLKLTKNKNKNKNIVVFLLSFLR